MTSRWSLVTAWVAVVLALCCACGSSPTPSAGSSEDPEAVRAAFIKGLNGFCQAWYDDQKRNDERYPNALWAHDFDVVEAAATRRDDRMLPRLHPLGTMEPMFARFVRNEKALLRSRRMFVQESRSGNVTDAQNAFNHALDVRHAISKKFGASECDGVLPPAQRRAAIAAVRHYELNRNPHQACFTLVTHEFTEDAFPSPAACLQHFQAQYSGLYPVPTGIRVSQVTGVENLSATVYFSEIPDCGCGEVAGRLYYEHGHWLIRSGYHVTSSPATTKRV